MYKIVVLNYLQTCIDIIPVSEKEYNDYGGDESFSADEFISDRGYDLGHCSWMLCTDDPCEIPVFWADETIPMITL